MKVDLCQYLGEHQSQAFYGSLKIHHDSSVIHAKLGTAVPADLSPRNMESKKSSKLPPCLCIPIHIFKRTISSTMNTGNRQSSAASDVSGSSSNLEATSRADASNSEQSGGNVNPQKVAKVLRLITVQVYYPVEYMFSANDARITSDLKKRIHVPPHAHEFISYPSLLTMSIDEFGHRICSGVSNISTLLPLSKEIPDQLTIQSRTYHNAEKMKELVHEPGSIASENEDSNSSRGRSSVTSTSENQFPMKSFVILPESLYNRISSMECMIREGFMNPRKPKIGWNVDVPMLPPDNTETPIWVLWTGLCTNRSYAAEQIDEKSVTDTQPTTEENIPERTGDNISNDLRLHKFKMTMSSLDVANRTQEFFLSSSVHHVHRSVATSWPLALSSRMVFVRRQSSDCGSLICNSFKSQKFTPARIRRTRVRGTDQLAIKLKRPVFPNIDSASQGDTRSEGQADLLSAEAIYEHFDSYVSSSSPQQSQHLIEKSNSPSLRPRRGGQVCYDSSQKMSATLPSHPLHQSASESRLLKSCDVSSSESSSSGSTSRLRSLRTHPPPAKRLDMIDRDLEIALQRSLADGKKGTVTSTLKRKIPKEGENIKSNKTSRLSSENRSLLPRALRRQMTSYAQEECENNHKLSNEEKCPINSLKPPQSTRKRKISSIKCDTKEDEEEEEKLPKTNIEEEEIKKIEDEKEAPSNPVKDLYDPTEIDTEVEKPLMLRKRKQANPTNVDASLNIEVNGSRCTVPKLTLAKCGNGKFSVVLSPNHSEEESGVNGDIKANLDENQNDDKCIDFEEEKPLVIDCDEDVQSSNKPCDNQPEVCLIFEEKEVESKVTKDSEKAEIKKEAKESIEKSDSKSNSTITNVQPMTMWTKRSNPLPQLETAYHVQSHCLGLLQSLPANACLAMAQMPNANTGALPTGLIPVSANILVNQPLVSSSTPAGAAQLSSLQSAVASNGLAPSTQMVMPNGGVVALPTQTDLSNQLPGLLPVNQAIGPLITTTNAGPTSLSVVQMNNILPLSSNLMNAGQSSSTCTTSSTQSTGSAPLTAQFVLTPDSLQLLNSLNPVQNQTPGVAGKPTTVSDSRNNLIQLPPGAQIGQTLPSHQVSPGVISLPPQQPQQASQNGAKLDTLALRFAGVPQNIPILPPSGVSYAGNLTPFMQGQNFIALAGTNGINQNAGTASVVSANGNFPAGAVNFNINGAAATAQPLNNANASASTILRSIQPVEASGGSNNQKTVVPQLSVPFPIL